MKKLAKLVIIQKWCIGYCSQIDVTFIDWQKNEPKQAAKHTTREITKLSINKIHIVLNPSDLLKRTVKTCAIMVGKKESKY